MKFGKTLKEEREYMEAWAEHFVSYGELKKLISAMEAASTPPTHTSINTGDALNPIEGNVSDSDDDDDDDGSSSNEVPRGLGVVASCQHGADVLASPSVSSSTRALLAHTDKHDEFFSIVRSDLANVNSFYECLLESLSPAYQQLCEDFSQIPDSRDAQAVRRENSLKQIYEKLSLLSHYCELNRTGFRKIVKKYDKKLGQSRLEAFMREEVDVLPFAKHETLTRWITDIEQLYADAFTHGVYPDAVKKLAYLRVHVRLATKNDKGLISLVKVFVGMFKSRKK